MSTTDVDCMMMNQVPAPDSLSSNSINTETMTNQNTLETTKVASKEMIPEATNLSPGAEISNDSVLVDTYECPDEGILMHIRTLHTEIVTSIPECKQSVELQQLVEMLHVVSKKYTLNLNQSLSNEQKHLLPTKKHHHKMITTSVLCSDCTGRHVFKECPRFCKRKKLTFQQSYCLQYSSETTSQTELDGYCAASLCLVRFNPTGGYELLVVKEIRNNKVALNFIGGKREKLSDSFLTTAIREFKEETTFEYIEESGVRRCFASMLLNDDEIRTQNYITVWIANSKQWLSFVRCEYDETTPIPNDVVWTTPSVQELIWYPMTSNKGQSATDWHPFAFDMLQQSITLTFNTDLFPLKE